MRILLIAGNNTFFVETLAEVASEYFEKILVINQESISNFKNTPVNKEHEFYCISTWSVSRGIEFSHDALANERLKKDYIKLFQILQHVNLIKLVHVGSYWESAKAEIPYSGYLTSKREISKLVESRTSRFDVEILELGDIIAINDPRKKLLPSLLKSYKNGSILEVSYPGNIFIPIDIYSACREILSSLQTKSGRKRSILIAGPTFKVSTVISIFSEVFGMLNISYPNGHENKFISKENLPLLANATKSVDSYFSLSEFIEKLKSNENFN